jgi:hypothetical protein
MLDFKTGHERRWCVTSAGAAALCGGRKRCDVGNHMYVRPARISAFGEALVEDVKLPFNLHCEAIESR